MPPPIKVELVAHSPDWAPAAQRAAAQLMEQLPGEIFTVHHIGSTSIPGIYAKPILDLIPVVRNLAALDAAQHSITSLGYSWWGEYGISGRRYCTFDDPATGRRLIQLHAFQFDSGEIEKHLAFRDYLRAHPEIAREYDREKHRCQSLHPDNSHDYSDCKAPWIERTLALALAARQPQN